jgi:cell division protein FtsB
MSRSFSGTAFVKGVADGAIGVSRSRTARITRGGSDTKPKGENEMKNMRDLRGHFLVACLCLGTSVEAVKAGDAKTSEEQAAIAQLQQQNQALQKRLDGLEDTMNNEGIKTNDAKDMLSPPPPTVSAATSTILSGYVQTSYFDNLENPSGGQNAGYLWNTRNNNFSINKVKLTLASPPVQPSGDKWDAGYRLSLLAGEDAPILNSNSGTTGFDLREAYVEFNVPVGTGLDIRAGEMISLLNYESGDGGAVNDNFSQGYQWYYTGDGPETGLQASYALTKWLTVVARIEDGLYSGAYSSRNKKGFMGSLNFTPSSNSWINLLGFGGQGVGTEDASGGEILAGYQVTKAFHLGFEGDFFHLSNDSGQAGDLYSAGIFTNYAFNPELSLAFRAEYIDDPNGAGVNVASAEGAALAPGLRGGTSAITSPDQSGDLGSFTLTLNWKPTPNLKIQPEVRVDTTSYSGGFNGKEDQIIAGAGITYLY